MLSRACSEQCSSPMASMSLPGLFDGQEKAVKESHVYMSGLDREKGRTFLILFFLPLIMIAELRFLRLCLMSQTQR